MKDGGWDPGVYLYPQFPIVAVVAAARVLDPVYAALRGRSLRDRIPAQVEVYDELEPFALLLLARLLNVALGLATIALTGWLGGRLAGARAGAAAALLAAVVPTLVLRNSLATVDSYATFFVIACLCFTDLTRTWTRAGVASLLAGAMAGGAFASKYPSAVVLTAFLVTTAMQKISWPERFRRVLLASVGLVAGAFLAMPALWKHPKEIASAIVEQSKYYAELVSPPLWKQALLRAEWDIPYERAELGFVFLALTAWGLFTGLRDRKIAATLCGWCTFAAACLILYGTRSFQAFRNLMPLVPLACVAVAILYVHLRTRTRPPFLTDAALAALVLAFAVPLAAYGRDRHRLEDPRKQAIDWLVPRVRPGDDVCVVHDLGFLHQEIERLPAKVAVRWWDKAQKEISASRPRFVVAGILRLRDGTSADFAVAPPIGSDYLLRFRVGHTPTPPDTGWWRGNDQIVSVFERKD